MVHLQELFVVRSGVDVHGPTGDAAAAPSGNVRNSVDPGPLAEWDSVIGVWRRRLVPVLLLEHFSGYTDMPRLGTFVMLTDLGKDSTSLVSVPADLFEGKLRWVWHALTIDCHPSTWAVRHDERETDGPGSVVTVTDDSGRSLRVKASNDCFGVLAISA